MPLPLMNITIAVPVGTSNHGDPDILCVPSKWNDVMLFYAVNYLAHAVTVKSLPGEKIENAIFIIALALIYPFSGLLRGMEAIARRAYWYRGSELQRAARAGALCIVVRNGKWQPLPGQIISNCKLQKLTENETLPAPEGGFEETDLALIPATWCTKLPKNLQEGFIPIGDDRTIHGGCHLPPGYGMEFLPSNAIVETTFSGDLKDVSIAASYNMLKAVVAIIQVCFTSVTIYKTRGDQIERYGYAAFGLTVLPYTIMSMVNLLGNLLTPDFPTLYMVESPEMVEAADPRRGGSFDGAVGVVKHQHHDYGYSVQFTATDDGFMVQEVEQPLAVDVVKKYDSASHSVENSSRSPRFQQSVNASTYAQDIELATIRSLGGDQDSVQVTAGAEKTPGKLSWANMLWKIYPDQQKTNGMSVNLMVPSTKQFEEEDPTMRLLPAPIPRTVRCSFHIRVPAASNFACEGTKAWGKRRLTSWGMLSFIMVSVPFAIISGLTHFEKGHSTLAQRVWTMSWLVMGTFWGSTLPSVLVLIKLFEDGMWINLSESGTAPGDIVTIMHWVFWMVRLGFLFTCAVFPIGGFVVVGQMLNSYGTCVKLS